MAKWGTTQKKTLKKGWWAFGLTTALFWAVACGKSQENGDAGPSPSPAPTPATPSVPTTPPPPSSPNTLPFVTGGGLALKTRDLGGAITETTALSGLGPGQSGITALTVVPTDMRSLVEAEYMAFATNTSNPSATTYDLMSLTKAGVAKPLMASDSTLFPSAPSSMVTGLLPNIVLFNSATGIRAFSPDSGGTAQALDTESAPFIRPTDTPCTFGTITRMVKLQSGTLSYLLVLANVASGGTSGAGLFVFSGLDSTLTCTQSLALTDLPSPASPNDVPVDAVQGTGAENNKVYVLFQNATTGGKIFSFTVGNNGLLASPSLVLASSFFLGVTVANSHMVYAPGTPNRLNVHNSTRNLYASIALPLARFMGFAPGGDTTALK